MARVLSFNDFGRAVKCFFVYWQIQMRKTRQTKKTIKKLISSILALMLLPYGAAQASVTQRGEMEATVAASLPSSPGSCAVLSRLGIETNAEDASLVEDKILSGADAVEICQQLPNANPGSECLQTKALGLLEEMPLGVRPKLIKELAAGEGLEGMAPEIIQQVSMPLVELLAQEGFNEIPLPIPSSEESSRGHASPAANGTGASKTCSPGHKIVGPKNSTDVVSFNHLSVSRVLAFRIIRSVYYNVTMMPTGPPAGNDTRSLLS